MMANGTSFISLYNKLDRNDALLVATVTAGRNDWSLYADYSTQLAGSWAAPTAEAELRLTL